MSNIENAVIDIFDDLKVPQTMQKVASGIPDRLRGVNLPTREERDLLDDSDFALSMITKSASKLNKFPVNDALNTALSNEYFDLNHHKLPGGAQKVAATYIKMACQRHSITPTESVKEASLQFPTTTNIYLFKMNDTPGGRVLTEKVAAHDKSDHFYALSKTASDGTTDRAYAMPNVESIKMAEAYFEKFAKQFSAEERHEFARNVVGRAVELGVNIESESVNKYAGLQYNADVDAYLSVRKELVNKRPEFVDALDKLASYQGKEDPRTFARVLHEFDKKAGLTRYYDKYLADPFASTFGTGSEKTASVIYEENGLTVTEADLVKVANEKYDTLKNYFGPTLADGIKKEGSAAFVALPDDAKEVIARIANGEIS